MNDVYDVHNRSNIVLQIENVEQLLEDKKNHKKERPIDSLGFFHVWKSAGSVSVSWEVRKTTNAFWFTNFVTHVIVCFCIFILISE